MSGVLYLENRRPPVYLSGAVVGSQGDEVYATVGDVHRALPVETLVALVLGPGCSIETKTVRSIVDGGCSVFWTSRQGLRLSTGCVAPTINSTVMARRQLLGLRSDRMRAATYRRALVHRFGIDPPKNYSVDSLRAWEGTQMVKYYRRETSVRGIGWDGRKNDESEGDYVNTLISSMNALVYSACEIATVSLLMSPHLGYSHTSRDAWIYDVADCMKNDVSISRALDWFMARDRRHDMEPPTRVALEHYDGIMLDVFGRFYDVCDNILPSVDDLE